MTSTELKRIGQRNRGRNRAGSEIFRLELLEGRQLLDGTTINIDDGTDSTDSWWKTAGYTASQAMTIAYKAPSIGDNAGTLYVAGQAQHGDGVYHGIVRMRDTSGGDWETVLNTETVNSGKYAASNVSFSAIAVGSNGTIYVGGSVGSIWTFLRSTDSWETWDVAQFQLSKNSASHIHDLAVDADGNVYAAGYAHNRGELPNWIVQEYVGGSPTAGKIIQSYIPPGSSASAKARCIAIDGGDLYVSGFENLQVKKAGYNVWVTQKLAAGETTWTGLERYPTYPSGVSWPAPWDIAVASDGTVYVVGEQLSATSNMDWMIRKGSTTGGVWTEIQPLSAWYWSSAKGVAIDANNNVLVCGYAQPNKGAAGHAMLIAPYDNGEEWGTIDNYYEDTPGRNCAYASVTTDSDGNAYVVGYRTDADGQIRWLVRQITTPFTWTPLTETSTPQALTAPATPDTAPATSSATIESSVDIATPLTFAAPATPVVAAVAPATVPGTFSTKPISDLLSDQSSVLGSKSDPVFVS